jgi:hypothetical protein
MTRLRQVDDRGEAADAPPRPRRSRNARACFSGRNFAPGAAILGSQVGSRAVDAPWWSFCLLTGLGLAAVGLQIVFPQDSPDKLTWWTERWRTKQRRPCPKGLPSPAQAATPTTPMEHCCCPDDTNGTLLLFRVDCWAARRAPGSRCRVDNQPAAGVRHQ